MKRVRIGHKGKVQWSTVTDDETSTFLNDGTSLPLSQVDLLAPVEPGASVFALGLNYADHGAELGFGAPQSPLVFMKGYNAFVGHGGKSIKPAGARQMHPECELVAVIGRTARGIRRQDALDYVAGYTVANDYAIRDYLENYYRPNLRVKNRDALTPLGPWITDAADVGDPQALTLSTRVNGSVVQEGSTSQMVFSVADMVEHLSEFMTLMPGDLILTGTPHGVFFVSEGDEVVCEIEKVGRLVNHVTSAP